jgi:putative PIN family toxin of toxin-antitoxin system
MPRLRIVLDTNVLVSGLTYPASIPGRIVNVWCLGGVDVILSRYILEEVSWVLPRLSHNTLTADEIRDLVDSFIFLADIVDPAAQQDLSLRDPADQPVLGTLLTSGADYLVTGDKDLLALANRHAIVTPARFWERHGN